MTEEQKTSVPVAEEQKIRHDMVITAVNFLLNPAVITKPYIHKTAFLKKKGLTDAEISLAYKQAENDKLVKDDAIVRQRFNHTPPPIPPPVPAYSNQNYSMWSQISRFSSSCIIIGVALFGAHYVYKTYIEPLLFGEDSKSKKSLEKQIFEMANSLSQLEKHVESLESNFKSQKSHMENFFRSEVNECYSTPLVLRELKTDIASVKSLLLNRHQFPAMPKVTPSIPAWQLSSNENSKDTTKQNGDSHEKPHPDEQNSSEFKTLSDIDSEFEDDDISQKTAEVNIEPKSVAYEHAELNNDGPLPEDIVNQE